MPAIRLVMKDASGQVKTARSQEAADHLASLGFAPVDEQPPQPKDDAPVLVKGPDGVVKRVKRRSLDHWVGALGYELVGGDQQERTDARHAERQDRADRAEKRRQRGRRREVAQQAKAPEAPAERKPTKAEAKKQAERSRAAEVAELLGDVKPGPHVNDIVMLLRDGYDVAKFRAVLTEWNVKDVASVRPADRAELLLDLRKRA